MTEKNVQELAVIIQCRLSSSRLPGKALKNLGGKSVFEWTMDSMKKVQAGNYIVATDEASYPELKPLAEKHGWQIIQGPLNDVLERYCIAINSCGCKTVLRATCDNPFLFYEAAQALVEEFFKQNNIQKCDYMTWTGLPHGCGVEIFNSESLLDAAKLTDDPYDREHVGPALYNHKNRFTSLFYKAPARFHFPDFRTTIDTPADYRRAISIVSRLSGGFAPSEPYTTEQIVSAVTDADVHDTVLFYPSTKKGQGTGHLRRCLKAAQEIKAFVYIPEDNDLAETEELLKAAYNSGLKDYQVIRKFPEINEFALIVTDAFNLDKETLENFRNAGIVVCIDEGGKFTDYADYVLDIIPSCGIDRKANAFNPAFIEKPSAKRTEVNSISKVLVCLGGEDPAGLTDKAAEYFYVAGCDVSVAGSSENKIKGVTYYDLIPDLKNHLYEYDLVVTHYGLTAFEAVSAGCGIILLPTSKLHEDLAKKYGFYCIPKDELEKKAGLNLSDANSFAAAEFKKLLGDENQSLGNFVKNLSHGKRYFCPVCGDTKCLDAVVARTPERTFRRCSKCGILYISWNSASPMKYEKSYFAEQYKQQYGKTYLEDFDSIKKQSLRRMQEINGVLNTKNSSIPKILDIGCAYGPFLAAAAENGWAPYGTDIARDAVEFVRRKLLFPAVQAVFPDFNSAAEFGINTFDAVTMWFVIEHFSDLGTVLEKVSSLVAKGGVFAFSTPSAEGVSGKKNTQSFFQNSPSDHFTIWEPSRVQKILKQFGFKVEKIVSTGHHPERFPQVKENGWKKGDPMFNIYNIVSHTLKLGDTFEVYCRKIGK